jgi:two-component system phosphate regulon sensor histidine kinase PhoR
MGWFIALVAAVVLSGWRWRARQLAQAQQEEIARLSADLETLRRSQSAEAANLRAILASMAEGVMVVDSAHIVRLANRPLLDLLDLRSAPEGVSVLQSVRDISFEEIVTDTLKNGEPRQAEVSLAHARPPRHLALSATPIRQASGEDGVLLICRDVTRLKQLEDIRREFVANVSHELRTPLAIFQGYLENLLDNPDIPRPDLVEVLEILKRHSTRLNLLVEDLLDLTRLESRNETLCLEPIEPQALVSDVAIDWRLQAKEKRIQFSAECAGDTPEFDADAVRIEQVLNNLVENALKYTDAGGSVRLRVGPCAGGIEFRVEDTGAGIPPQDLPHIFERFYRADKARTREQGGTGLGLSIVKHITQLHGGTIRADSTYGKGTTVVVTIPSQIPSSASAAEMSSEVKPGVNGHEHPAEPHLIE